MCTDVLMFLVHVLICSEMPQLEACGEVDGNLYAFLTFALEWGVWLGLCCGCLTPHRSSPWYLLDRKLIGPQGQAGGFGDWKNLMLSSAVNSIVHPSSL
jgi:hypothetical protein